MGKSIDQLMAEVRTREDTKRADMGTLEEAQADLELSSRALRYARFGLVYGLIESGYLGDAFDIVYAGTTERVRRPEPKLSPD